MKLSIIIPVYNEEATLLSVLNDVVAAPLPAGVTREILAINDGSTDATRAILDEFSHPDTTVIHLPSNQGKTAAIKKGIEAAGGEAILIQDADLEYPPRNYSALLEPYLKNNAPVVYGSRFLGSTRDMTSLIRTGNRLTNITFNLLYGTRLTDITTCHKLFQASLLKSIPVTSSDFSFETEISARLVRMGTPIIEVPIDYAARSRVQGKKMNSIKAVKMFLAIFKSR